MDSIAVLDFGSQYSQLIARRLREVSIYCELFPHDTAYEQVERIHPAGFILSGGPASVLAAGAPRLPDYVLPSGKPILGICYGMQLLAYHLNGRVITSARREYGYAQLHVQHASPLLPEGTRTVWMSHGDRIDRMPPGFSTLASTPNSPIAGMGDPDRKYYGLQFHPEVHHTQNGTTILETFATDLCGIKPDWTPRRMVDQAISDIRSQVGNNRAVVGVSGGVDSSVAAAISYQALGDRLTAVFVDNGLLRIGERELVQSALAETLQIPLVVVDAAETFLKALKGVTDPETKRRIIGEHFIRTFEDAVRNMEPVDFLVQGTIYPDVVESSAPDRSQAARIKTHHNVGGLPEDLSFKLVEPLRYLFKDEVRKAGLELGLPASLVNRQPFPGPGLAVRCLGEVTDERLERVRQADAIFIEELTSAGLLGNPVAQALVTLLPVRSVGVMGDQRTYGEAAVLRAVTTEDFMTADWARIPHDLLGKISTRIVNEVEGINRVVLDLTSKPPGTIEWE
ncbi:MAG: glutamine-hydrolyzing GMP synthase [Anaerolineales bacterium]|nr:glutamine-hydrolyzing GMP synthase [Anaerolineales bacterium]